MKKLQWLKTKVGLFADLRMMYSSSLWNYLRSLEGSLYRLPCGSESVVGLRCRPQALEAGKGGPPGWRKGPTGSLGTRPSFGRSDQEIERLFSSVLFFTAERMKMLKAEESFWMKICLSRDFFWIFENQGFGKMWKVSLFIIDEIRWGLSFSLQFAGFLCRKGSWNRPLCTENIIGIEAGIEGSKKDLVKIFWKSA